MPNVTPKMNPKSRTVESFDQLLRRFKKEVDNAGTIDRVRELQFFEKPNVIRNQKNQQLKRRKKLEAAKRAAPTRQRRR